MIFNTAIAIVIAYLLGSIPFAYIASCLKKGTDIRQMGGGNVGAGVIGLSFYAGD
jgi:glycerol-3-phosphate acyltransferase PlsY